MALFENALWLLAIALVLLQIARRARVPYPTMLALAGALVGALPWAPEMTMDPHLALAVFVAPALMDAAYDTPPRELRRHWVPLIALAVLAVLVTTAAVAWAGWAIAGLPIAAAIALGAIVAPPDAAAASAVLQRFELPRRTRSILEGESLLNDAVALLVYSAAVSAATASDAPSAASFVRLVLAGPGGVVLGLAMGKLYLATAPRMAGTLAATVLELVTTFGTWVVADRLRLSPILAIVAFAAIVASHAPARQAARDRVHSYSVWQATVFVLNVVAFSLMGLQARTIVARLGSDALAGALGFAGIVLVVTVIARIAWVAASGAFAAAFLGHRAQLEQPSVREGAVIAWCGMRGLVTLATAFALPADFPHRDLVVLSAFAVVIGTLVVQGLTMTPLLALLRIGRDHSLEDEVSSGRRLLIDAAMDRLACIEGEVAAAVRSEYEAIRTIARDRAHTEHDRVRMMVIARQREVLARLRRDDRIADDAFHRLEEELDWSELSAARHAHDELAQA
ncbi:cation:proton antiporter [Sandaracinus amylolyticus]|uniref:Na+/H+ antiporter n=1 Tax=Sandaracinus amylolyticus TaxID=927083 RepID=A0A0F6WAP9_9BACT|nr:cation:proton antiporter [Sandaracinus amylolyticus]AKF11717.1 Na+/H+ antiporter [Sandaracinus amylolyticus]